MGAGWQPQLSLSRHCKVSDIRERSAFTHARERKELITPKGFRLAAALNRPGTGLKDEPEGYCDDATAAFNSPEGLHANGVVTCGSTCRKAGGPAVMSCVAW